MEYLHPSSVPATKSELELFSIPPTQTAIESSYEIEIRPTSSLDASKTYEFIIPASDDFTDLSSLRIYAIVKITPEIPEGTLPAEIEKFWNTIKPCENFGNALFEQVDVSINNQNIGSSNNLYAYQAFLEDVFYRHKTKSEIGNLIGEEKEISTKIHKKSFDLFFRLHSSVSQQDNLLLNAVPISIKMIRAKDDFSLINIHNFKARIAFEKISLHLKRVKLYPDIESAINLALEKSSAKYFITRNEIKSFSILSGLSSVSVENVFSGTLPKRLIVGFVSNNSFSGNKKSNPFEFKNFNINHISAHIDGVQYPGVPYTPDFKKDHYLREYVGLYTALSQDEGIPQLDISYEDYKNNKCFFAFDLSPDGYLGGETGTLSLLKRGYIRIEFRMSEAASEAFHMIALGQFDNLIQIDKFRNVVLDY